MRSLLTSTIQRVTKDNTDFRANTNVSQTAKDLMDQATTTEKQHLNDTMSEYISYLNAGQPTFDSYNAKRQKAIGDAKGCTDFLCNLGRLASDAASSAISYASGGIVKLNPNNISNLVGITNPTPYLNTVNGTYTTSAVPNVNGQYVLSSVSGNQTIPFSQCVGYAVPSGGGFVEKAYAQDTSSLTDTGFGADQFNAGFSDTPATDTTSGGSSLSSSGTSSIQYDPTTDTYYDPTSNQTYDPATGQFTSGPNAALSGSNSTSTGTKQTTANTGNSFLNTILKAFGGTISGQLRSATGVGTGCSSRQPSTTYSTPFGAYPVGQALGYNNNNLSLNASTTSYASQLQQILQALASQNSSYNSAAQVLSGTTGQMTLQQLSALTSALQNTNLSTVPATNSYWTQYPQSLFVQLCAQVLTSSNASLIQTCRQIFTPTTAAATALPATGTVGTQSTIGSTGATNTSIPVAAQVTISNGDLSSSLVNVPRGSAVAIVNNDMVSHVFTLLSSPDSTLSGSGSGFTIPANTSSPLTASASSVLGDYEYKIDTTGQVLIVTIQ